ncbi:MAG: Hpt domain-containing protein [Sulfuricurvum sp.]|nr:Hpt domain-containing protein [Sulfuricurvum sp.]MDP3022362.1 Hpt domain-containing protein [Sulfuricurvum sp.]MDP3119335.1 Hpt domain-containing protein [Sulfuricurvum sp.]
MKTHEEQIQEFEKVFGELKAMLHLSDEVMIRLNNKFFESVSSTLVALNEAIRVLDYETIEMLAHSIKGSAGSLRYTAINEIAQELEKRAHEKENHAYLEDLASLEKQFNTADESYKLWKNKMGLL